MNSKATSWRAFWLPRFLFPKAPSERKPTVSITAEFQTFFYGWEMNGLRGDEKPREYDYSIHCIAGTNEWRMDVTETNGAQNWCFDGTNIYNKVIRAYDSSYASNSLGINWPVVLWQSDTGYPLENFRVNIPWLGFLLRLLSQTGGTHNTFAGS